MSLALKKEVIQAPAPNSDLDEIRQRAHALFQTQQSKDLAGAIAQKRSYLQQYDVRAMDRVVAIVSWGRSGSLLLASYLDGHEDVITLPELCGSLLYQFFDRFPALSWREKLLAYPAFDPIYVRFFEGEFAISPDQYYAAVQAIGELYGDWPQEFLESRRTFFLFVHIAYTLALGRRPASPHPLIVHAHHHRDDGIAGRFVEDFPQAKFIHTVRDPISSCDGIFHYNLPSVQTQTLLPFFAVYLLILRDRVHTGMESRSRTVRFEDLHANLPEIMRDLSDWLALPYRTTLLESTFNEIPYVVSRDGKPWSGPRLEQLQRRSHNLSRKDRVLLFALFYENFVEWDYPYPRVVGKPMIRCLLFLSLVLLPFKMERLGARAVIQRGVLPELRKGHIWPATKTLLGIGFCRLKIIRLLVPALLSRCFHGTTVLQVVRPLERRKDEASGATGEMKFI